MAARAGAYAFERSQQAGAVGQAGRRVLAGAAVAVALGQHRGYQDAVEPVRGDAHADQVERDLDEDDGRDVFAREGRAQAHRPQAEKNHGADEPGRAIVAKADTAGHGPAGHAGQRGGQPIPIKESDEDPIAHAERPQQRQQDVDVGMGVAALGCGFQGRPQDRDADDRQDDLQRQPGQVQRFRAPPGDDAGDHQCVDDPAGENGECAEKAGDQRRADVRGRIVPGMRQPTRQAPFGQAELQCCIHAVTSLATSTPFQIGWLAL
ncbi:hypothetical protein FQZ97_802610 [compost metagenome]